MVASKPRKPPVGYRAKIGKTDALIAKVPQHAAPATVITGRTILAIDPGGSTGVALRFADGSIRTNTITDPADLWELLGTKPDFVVFEIFATGGRVDRYMIYTIELVGGIKAVCFSLGIRSFAHSPGKRYPYLGAARELVSARHVDRHEVDALGHLLAWEATHVTVDA